MVHNESVQGEMGGVVVAMVTSTHIESSEHCYVEWEELQWYDCEDALDAVHRAGYRDASVGALQSLLIIILTDDDGSAL